MIQDLAELKPASPVLEISSFTSKLKWLQVHYPGAYPLWELANL